MPLSIENLGRKIADRRGTQGVRAAAKEIGISSATLSRVENGNVPDLATFAKICSWLGEDPNNFLGMQPATKPQETVSVQFRKKDATSIDTANALGSMIVKAQQALRDRESL